MKIIVLSATNYKEKDTIINAISIDGAVSFKVRGGQVSGSPLNWINNPMIIAEAEYVENVRYIHQILKTAKLIYSPFKDTTLANVCSINLVSEAVMRMLPEDERHIAFNLIEEYFLAAEKLKDPSVAELVFLAKMIKLTGSEPEVEQCVFCGSRSDIVAFSFLEGGFICRNCLSQETQVELTPSQMKWVRYLFKVENFNEVPDGNVLNDDDRTALFSKFHEFIYEGIGIGLESIPFLLQNK